MRGVRAAARAIRGFAAFLWDFVVGDDWTAAIGVIALLVVARLTHAWWLLPPAVVALLAVTLVRARRAATPTPRVVDAGGTPAAPVADAGRAPAGRPVDEDPVEEDPVGGNPVGGDPVGGNPVGGDPVGGDPARAGRPVGGGPSPQ